MSNVRNNKMGCYLQVMPLADLSARTRAGGRCFKRMLFCNLPGLWKQPFDQNWIAGLQPSLVGQKVLVQWNKHGQNYEHPLFYNFWGAWIIMEQTL